MIVLARSLLPATYLPLKWGNDIGFRLRTSPKGMLRILLSHDIPPEQRSNFKKQIQSIARTWTFISPSEFTKSQEAGEPINGRKVMMTFDDGFHSNRWVAEAVLDPLGIKALFFIPSDFIDITDVAAQKSFIANKVFGGMIKLEQVPKHARPMTWGDLKALVAAGHEMGSHTCSHTRLSDITSRQQLEHEVIDSKARLEQMLGMAVTHFAFPFGNLKSINPEALSLARKHYQFVYSGIRGPNTHATPHWAVRRDSMQPNDTPLYVRSVLEGALDPYYAARARSLERMSLENRT